MPRKNNIDVINLLRNFQKNLDNHPPTAEMYDEVRMMKFKIKPVQGDISLLNLNDQRLIEVLWRLGKLDDFFQSEFGHLNKKNKEVFYSFFESLHNNLQNQLNHLNLKDEYGKIGKGTFFEIEIIKEGPGAKKIN